MLSFREVNTEGDDVAELISSSKSSHHNDVVPKPVTLWSKIKTKCRYLFLGVFM